MGSVGARLGLVLGSGMLIASHINSKDMAVTVRCGTLRFGEVRFRVARQLWCVVLCSVAVVFGLVRLGSFGMFRYGGLCYGYVGCGS